MDSTHTKRRIIPLLRLSRACQFKFSTGRIWTRSTSSATRFPGFGPTNKEALSSRSFRSIASFGFKSLLMVSHARSSWLLFPPAAVQAPTYPHWPLRQHRASDTVVIRDLNSASEHDQRRSSSSPVWWERSVSNKRIPRAPLSELVRVNEALRYQECDETTHIPQRSEFQGSDTSPKQNRCSSTASLSGSSTNSSSCTVVKWPLSENPPFRGPLPCPQSPTYSDGSDKENKVPQDSKAIETDRQAAAKQWQGSISNSNRHASTSRSHAPLSRDAGRHISKTLQNSCESSPAVSPRPFLRRLIPSERFVTSPLRATSLGRCDTFVEYDMMSQIWTHITTSSDEHLLAQHTLCLDLLLPPRRWISETARVSVIVEGGLWVEHEIGVHVQGRRADLPPAEYVSAGLLKRTTLVLFVPKADLKSTLTLNVRTTAYLERLR